MDSKNNILSEKNSTRRLMFVLMVSFWIGEIIGTAVFCGNINDEALLIEKFFYNRFELTFGQAVINSFAGVAGLVVICAVLGMGAFFHFAEFSVPLFYGLGSGILLAEFNYSYGIKGMMLGYLIIVPYIVVSAMIVVVAAREAVSMSNVMLNNLIGRKDFRKINLELYITKYIILLMILFVSALADGAMNYFVLRLWLSVLGISE